ncbi:MAG: hypothetical protein GWP91_13040 [Rhodobacterales bacterium]|nr:hypothetical protein [Rhodobacterales bacterium]
MRDSILDITREAEVSLTEGMDTHLGRVVQVSEEAVLCWLDGATTSHDPLIPIANLRDPATYFMGLAVLAARTGLEPGLGMLWYLNDEDDGDQAWVLEGTDEVRTRDADTHDQYLSLARGLFETR